LGCTAAVLTLDPRSVAEVLTSIVAVGEQLDEGDAARSLVDELRERLDALTRALADTPRPPVLVLEWTDPPFTAGHWVPDLVTAGGGTAVLAVPGGASRRITWDDVRSAAAEG